MITLKYTKEERNKLADEFCNKNDLIRIEECTGFHNRFKAIKTDGYLVYPNIKTLKENKRPLIFDGSNPYAVENIKTWIRINDKNFELISEEYSNSQVNLRWVCKNCKCNGYNKEFLQSWKIIQKVMGCPECGKASRIETHQTPVNGKSLFDKYSGLCEKYWDYSRNDKEPNQYYPYSNQKVYWKCNACDHLLENKLMINNVVRLGISCPQCSDGVSYPEKFMFNVLLQLNVNFKRQIMFDWSKNVKHSNIKLCGNKLYDFWLIDYNFIIETNGNQHYNKSMWKTKTLKEIHENDKLKEKLAKENQIERYIIINCEHSELEWMKYNLINSELSNIFDLTEIDWMKCHEFACNSLVKEAANLWNEGIKNANKIGEIIGLSRSVVINYLKQSSEIGWCDYDAKEAMVKSATQNGKKNNKPIIQLTTKGEYVTEYNSMTEASKQLNLHVSNISRVCVNHRSSTGGFVFMFKEDYIRNKSEEELIAMLVEMEG